MHVSTDQKEWATTFPPSYLHIKCLHKRLPETALSIFSMAENLDFLLILVYYYNLSSSVTEHQSHIVQQLEAAQAMAFTPKQRKGISKKLGHMEWPIQNLY